jgi:hypothetical protein
MTILKIIFLLILAMLERCHIVSKQVEPLSAKPSEIVEERDTTDITGSWVCRAKLTEKTDKTILKNNDAIKTTQNSVVNEELLLSFFQDSTFTEIARTGQYRRGNYELIGQTLSLQYDDNTEKFSITFDTISAVHRALKMKDSKGHQNQFIEHAFPLKNFEEDPFYPANNTWRVKPDKPESHEQIQRRLTNYLKHSCAIFKAASARNQSSISWVFSKGIIRVYDRAVGSVGPEDLPEAWVNCFYSKHDAIQAYNLFNRYLRAYKPNGESTGNWVIDDYNILVKIHDLANSESTLQ